MATLTDTIMHALHQQNVWEHLDFPILPPSAPQGWHGDHPSLSRLASTKACVIDVGVWKGDSTITLARAMRDNDIDGCVIAVDTFLGSPEHYTVPQYSNLFKRANGRPNLYEIFMSNVIAAGVKDFVVPFPQTSIAAASILQHLGIKADLVHVDAAHEYGDVKRDCIAFWDLLVPGGYLIGDDYSNNWPGVIRAAGEFSADHQVPLFIDGPKWIVQKP